jgi:hypothetical protein
MRYFDDGITKNLVLRKREAAVSKDWCRLLEKCHKLWSVDPGVEAISHAPS